MVLTDKGVKALKPQLKDNFIADGSGLYLRVQKSGTKTFIFRSRVGGAARWVTLGVYPAMSLLEARTKALEFSNFLPKNTTVQDAYDEWFKRSIQKTYKRPDNVQARMGKHFVPAFGTRSVASITRTEVSTLLSNLAEVAPVQANRVLTDIKLFFSYSVERGWIDLSPAQLITQKTAGGREKSRERVLTDDEIVSLLTTIRAKRFQPRTNYALLLLLFTGQRSEEVRGIERGEATGRVWCIPPHRTKNNITQRVTLNLYTYMLLEYVFNEFGNKPFDGMKGQTLSKAIRRTGVTWTPHDLRRTMATRMADMGVAPHVVEKCLNHTMSGVMAIYNRAEYAKEKNAAWRLWTRRLLRVRKKSPDTGG